MLGVIYVHIYIDSICVCVFICAYLKAQNSPLEKQVREWIIEALEETKSQKIIGKEITPFVLDYIRIASDGKSVSSNISLVKNNAKLASQIAIELNKKD